MNSLVYLKNLLILKWNTWFRKKEDKPGPMFIYEQDDDKQYKGDG